jgi:hypothetical protein
VNAAPTPPSVNSDRARKLFPATTGHPNALAEVLDAAMGTRMVLRKSSAKLRNFRVSHLFFASVRKFLQQRRDIGKVPKR